MTYVRPDEISIEVSEQTLRRLGLTFDQVADAVRRTSLDMPGGSIKAEGGEILLRTQEQAYRGADFRDIVVVSRTDGTSVRLDEIAEIVDGFQEGDTQARFDGRPAAMVKVYQVGNEDVVQISDRVAAYVDQAQARMPDGIQLTIWQDESDELKARIDILLGTAAGGLALVLLLLALPLQFRLAMWVAAGIPIAMLGTIAVFGAVGITISTMSVVAFILVLGIVVDDAIVVGERVFAHERHGEDQITAAVEGTAEVAVPVIFGVLTTIAAFIPLMFTPGDIGQLFSVVGYVVVICLVFSIIESQLILPAHLAHRRVTAPSASGNAFTARWRRFQKIISTGIERYATETYGPALNRVLEWRYLALAGGVGVLAVALGLIFSGRIEIQFLPAIEGDRILAQLEMPEGVDVAETARGARQIEAAALVLKEELDAAYTDRPSLVQHVFSSVGQALGGRFRSAPQSHTAEMVLAVLPLPERGDVSVTEMAERWRELTGPIHDSVQLTFSTTGLTAGDAIAIRLQGRNVDESGECRRGAARRTCALRRRRGYFRLLPLGQTGGQALAAPRGAPIGPDVERPGASGRARPSTVRKRSAYSGAARTSASWSAIQRRSGASLGDLEKHADPCRRRHRDPVCGGGRYHPGARLLRHYPHRPPARRHGTRRRRPRRGHPGSGAAQH